MKKAILSRFFAMTMLALASLMIKSEATCNPQFNCVKTINLESQIIKADDDHKIPELLPDEGFLIKI